MNDAQVTQREKRFFLGGIILLLLVTYGFSLFNDFVYWDDPLLILENAISQGMSFWHLKAAFTTYDPDLYVPLTYMSFQINYLIGGLHPFIYHLTNLGLHAGSSILVASIILYLTKNKWIAAVTALLFALHPINTEAVAWASARKDVLSSFFFLLSLWSYLRYRAGQSSRWYIGGIAAFLFGLLSKVSILGLPFILLLTDWYRTGRVTKKDVVQVAPFFLLSIAFGIVSLFGKMGGQYGIIVKMFIGTKAAVLSLWHLAWPTYLSVLYPQAVPVNLLSMDLLLPFLAVLAVSIIALLRMKKYPAFAFCWLWFLILLAPSFLTPEKGQDLVPELYVTSDRYVYLAAIGIFLGLAILIHRFARFSPRLPSVVTGLIVIGLASQSFAQSFVWSNTETLLDHALEKNPESAIAHNNLGAYYNVQGMPDEALGEFVQAVKLGGTGDAWYNLGVALMQKNIVAEAIQAFQNAIILRPSHMLAHLNLGALLLDSNRVDEAVDHLLTAQSLDPTNVVTYLNLGAALEKKNNLVDARRAYRMLLQFDPENSIAKERLEKIGEE